jgi:hypothetical protein
MLPEDGRRPKHVGAFKYFSLCFLNTENISAFVGFSWKKKDILYSPEIWQCRKFLMTYKNNVNVNNMGSVNHLLRIRV